MLTDLKCRSAQPGAKPVKLFDGHGLHLLVTPSGFKSWRLKYRFGGKEKQLTLGPYPAIPLREARERSDSARRMLREGKDPGEAHRQMQARRMNRVDESRTFRAAAERWYALRYGHWRERHAHDVLTSLENDAYPALGEMALADIRPADLREVLLAVQNRGAVETAHRLQRRISAIFQLAIASELVEIDPAASVAAVLKPVMKRMYPALLKLDRAQAFLRAVEAEPGLPATKLASRLLALTAARPGMIRWAQLVEFEYLDTDQPIWRIPASKMKLEREKSEQDAFEFVIPLSPQAVDCVKVAAVQAMNRDYLFPSPRHSHLPMSENALVAAYRRIASSLGRHVPHGWRSSFSTIMNERAIDLERPGDRAIIDLMLAHRPSGVEAKYNRAAYMKRRRELAQEWADLLLEGFAPAASLTEGPRRSTWP